MSDSPANKPLSACGVAFLRVSEALLVVPMIAGHRMSRALSDAWHQAFGRAVPAVSADKPAGVDHLPR